MPEICLDVAAIPGHGGLLVMHPAEPYTRWCQKSSGDPAYPALAVLTSRTKRYWPRILDVCAARWILPAGQHECGGPLVLCTAGRIEKESHEPYLLGIPLPSRGLLLPSNYSNLWLDTATYQTSEHVCWTTDPGRTSHPTSRQR